ncbi:RNA polymerase III subunit C53 [Yamadazyma tenuis]|uniref:DNA-directed RNA polymerase III subunit RPC4 n=1 Tax=Candida tenuis (strain ATCC 10573 / BCRC 21748 / CBS 615 / JCM 9827 / NBRC 10315 / NRRL Y-1498 / VKM Y-70) TaxID=590646 RepID=G3B0H8_CANTC|nr:uncharacterized protein CANTEDRAFT_92628 [Yamadazyma tenuis ATCC 10573]EGV65405.1 hypothetical protein CANTEDRAFT_92628 [Yamadazyma tenuis ATCC 10573]WEJ94925.1 RNA polymerase III subunit C53 [Yamadazyma tenuis]
MSNRLESLNTKQPGAVKPSLKFKPKAVERKSKEERAKHVQVKQEDTSDRDKFKSAKPPRGQRPARGRGGRHNQYANTHVLSSGLLSSGAVSGGFAKDTKVVNSASPSPDFLSNLKLKQPAELARVSASESDDEGDDGLTKIDMAKQYRFADEETVLFPVRPVRDDSEPPEVIALGVSKEPSPVKEEPLSTNDVAYSAQTELQRVLQTKANLESKISQPVDMLSQVEAKKLAEDHDHIAQLMSRSFESNDDKFSLFQLPKLLPEYSPKSKEDKAENSKLNGQIGHLNIHKSGRITINLGNDINLDVTAGIPSTFLQEFVLLDLTPAPESPRIKTEEDMDIDAGIEINDQNNDNDEPKYQGTINKLGEVDGKFIATPII